MAKRRSILFQWKEKPTIFDVDTVSNLDENPAERRGISDNFRWKSDRYLFVSWNPWDDIPTSLVWDGFEIAKSNFYN